MNEPLVRWEWVDRHLDDIARQTWEHVVLTGVSVGVGFLIALCLSAVALRFRWTYAPITWVTGVMYTIPSLALFALLVPYTGLTRLTALIGLVSYTLLILIRNIVAGVDAVPVRAVEAADALGYRRWRRWWTVELPIAVPVIIAGLRIASVTVVGLVTVTALIGQGGLGALILDGLQRFFTTPLLVGSVLSVALAVVLDVSLAAVERLVTPWARRRGR